MDNPDALHLMQFVSRAREAADRIEADVKEIERLNGQIHTLLERNDSLRLDKKEMTREIELLNRAAECKGLLIQINQLQGDVKQLQIKLGACEDDYALEKERALLLKETREERDMCEQALSDRDVEIERLKALWYADADPEETEYAEDYYDQEEDMP
jgi:chromosome segregation ATPase